MTQFNTKNSKEFLEFVQLLEEQTPDNIPGREDIIRNTARAWLYERLLFQKR